jgi:hypothetical protein
VRDFYWDCCYSARASTTGDTTENGTTTDTNTDTGTTSESSTGTGTTTSGGTTTTTWGTTSPDTTSDGCVETTVSTYECAPLPPHCAPDDPNLGACLANAFCQVWFEVKFVSGVLDCDGPPHGCY